MLLTMFVLIIESLTQVQLLSFNNWILGYLGGLLNFCLLFSWIKTWPFCTNHYLLSSSRNLLFHFILSYCFGILFLHIIFFEI
jgi:hypothetical protein